MCLDTVDKVTKEYTEGYKIFVVNQGGKTVSPELFMVHKRFNLHQWIEDPNCGERIYYDEYTNHYKSGFHFFVNLKDAYAWMGDSNIDCEVFKIKVRNIVASGKQRLYGDFNSRDVEVGVAKEMYIEKELT